MKATIRVVDNMLVVSLADGKAFVEEDPLVIAELLWAHSVRAAEVTMVDWHSDSCAAPLTGHKVAIYGRLRELEMGDQ